MNLSPSWKLGFLLLPLLGACGNDRSPKPATTLTSEQKDRVDLVLQPKPDWKPEGAQRKLKIMLLMAKSRVRKGERFQYRLESQNVGREPIAVIETAPSFTKDGSLCGESGFKLYATPPKGKEFVLECAPRTKAEVQASTEPAKDPESPLELTLQPGEYLLTKGPNRAYRFRDLESKYPFDAPGTYKLKAVFVSTDGFRAASNMVDLEVVP